jgi:hypothetical protein
MVTPETIERMARSAVVRGPRAGPYSFAVGKGGKAVDLLLYGQTGLFPFLDYEVHWLWRI